VQHFHLYKLPKSKLTNVNILCLVPFGSGRNKWVQLLVQSRNGGRTIRSLVGGCQLCNYRAVVTHHNQQHRWCPGVSCMAARAEKHNQWASSRSKEMGVCEALDHKILIERHIYIWLRDHHVTHLQFITCIYVNLI